MFVPNFSDSIPGYTGHRQSKPDEHDDIQQHSEARK